MKLAVCLAFIGGQLFHVQGASSQNQYRSDAVSHNPLWRPERTGVSILRQGTSAVQSLAQMRQKSNHTTARTGRSAQPDPNPEPIRHDDDLFHFRDFQDEGIIPGQGLPCVAWRKALNCDPSGPRDPMDDKSCFEHISALEAGFCECQNLQHTWAVPCGHRPSNCNDECHKMLAGVKTPYEEEKKVEHYVRTTDFGHGPWER